MRNQDAKGHVAKLAVSKLSNSGREKRYGNRLNLCREALTRSANVILGFQQGGCSSVFEGSKSCVKAMLKKPSIKTPGRPTIAKNCGSGTCPALPRFRRNSRNL